MVDNKENVQDEIDLVELAKIIWSRRWFIGKVTGIFIILGLMIAFTSPEEYETSSTLIPELAGEEGKLGGSLGGLASLAGVDLGGLSRGSQTINPALYQSVSQSTPFLLELMNQRYFFSEVGEEITLYEYYMNYYKVSLFGKLISIPGTVLGWIKGTAANDRFLSPLSKVLTLSEDQQVISEDLQLRVFVEMDWELNVVIVQVKMQDPVVAAEMVQFTLNYITRYVTNYSISKSKQQLESVEIQYEERKVAFEKVQNQLASFRDKNQNVSTARARSEQERLQSEYNLAFNVYNQLAQQKEAIKLQIQENTPVFTVLEPVKVPIKKSEPKIQLYIFAFGFLGLILGFIIMIFKIS
jgi:hypothetical protein